MQNDTLVAVDLAKAVFEVAVSDRPGRVAPRALPAAQFLSFFAQPCGHRGDGGVRLGPLLGAPHRRPRPRGGAAAAPPRASLRAAQQDRPHRRQGHARGQPQRGDPSRAGQDRRPAGPRLAASSALRVAGRAHRAHQRPARPAARARRLHPGSALAQVVPAVWALIEDAERDLPDALRPLLPSCARDPRHRGRIEASSSSSRRWPSSCLSSLSSDHPGHRPADRHRSGRLHRRHPALPLRPTLGQLPRPDAPGVLERPATPTRAHLQARRRLPAHAAHPRRALRPAARQAKHPTASAPGPTTIARPTSTTRPPWRSPTSSPESSGPSGSTTGPISRHSAA